ncbi:hypothetical protein [Brucella sp.]|uniref:hypothetical protein n=1 Tax=Brucella sp. TaxID=52132 RepID=UPI0028AA9C30|nr:hypothetical protein [Brucella sp.]
MSQANFKALIKNAAAQLEALAGRVQPGACYDNQAQAESFFQFEDYLKEIDLIFTDLRIGVIDETRGWGNQQGMSRVQRKMLREKTNDDRDGLLEEAREWAEEERHGAAA